MPFTVTVRNAPTENVVAAFDGNEFAVKYNSLGPTMGNVCRFVNGECVGWVYFKTDAQAKAFGKLIATPGQQVSTYHHRKVVASLPVFDVNVKAVTVTRAPVASES